MVEVAAFAASAAGGDCATMRLTGRPTSSAAIVGSRSYCPSAQRYSIVTFRPSANPASPNPRRNILRKASACGLDNALRRPIIGIACCARAASGHVAAAPPRTPRNSRRLTMSAPRLQETTSYRLKRTLIEAETRSATAASDGGRCPLWVQKRTSGPWTTMSALPPKADIGRLGRDVCYVPVGDMGPPIRSSRRRPRA